MDRSTLNKATSADDTPTPGYLCTEIAQATFVDVTACQQLADYLLKKLERDNPHVKAKVLRLIRFVCDNGKADFRRAMQRKADVVKACLQYRGQPDPLRGDALNKAVRESADAAVKSIFSADSQTNAYGVKADAGKKLQSFGSEEKDDLSSHIGTLGGPRPGGSSFSSSGGMGGPGGPRSFGSGGMVGFGNDPSDVPGQGSSKETMFRTAMSSTISAVSKISSMVPGMSGADKSAMEPPGPSTGAYRAPPAMPTMGAAGPWGGGAASGGFGAAAAAAKGPAVSRSSGEYEARVVADICTPGGARVAPSAAALQEFVQKCESLDAIAVGEQLGQRLGSPDWQTKAKALYAVESLAQNNLDGIVGHLSQNYSAQLFEAQRMPQCQQKATKVLVMLGLTQEDELPRTSAAHTAAPAAAAPVTDLLDFGDAAPEPAPVHDFGRGGTDLLDTGSTDLLEAPSAPVSNSLLEGLNGAPAIGTSNAPVQSVPAQPAAAGGLFGSLSMHNSSAVADAPVPMSSGQPSLLASLEAQSQMQAQPPADMAAGAMQQGAGPGLFANLSMSSGPMYSGAQGTMPGPPMPCNTMSGIPSMMGSQPTPMQPQMNMQQQLPQAAPPNPALGMPFGGGMQPSAVAPGAPGSFGMAGPGGPVAGGAPGMSSGSSAFGFISAAPAPAAGMPGPAAAPMQGAMQPGMPPAMGQGMLPAMQPGVQPFMAPAMPPSMPAMPPPSAMPPPGAMAGPMGFQGPVAGGGGGKDQPAKSDNAFNFVSEQMRLHVQQSEHTAPAPALECH